MRLTAVPERQEEDEMPENTYDMSDNHYHLVGPGKGKKTGRALPLKKPARKPAAKKKATKKRAKK